MTTKARPDRAQQLLLRGFLKRESKPAAGLLRFSIALGTFNALLMIAGAYLLAKIVHEVMFDAAGLNDVSYLLWALGGIILARGIFLALSQRLSAHAARNIKSSMRANLLEKITRLGPAFTEQKGHGAMLNTLHDGVEALHDYYANYLPSVAYSALIPLAILVVIFPTDWQAGLIFLFTAPLIPFFMILVGHKAEQLNQARWQQLAVLGNYFFDRVRGLTQLKLFNATKRELTQIAKISDDFRHATLSVLKIAFLSSFALEFLATISVALVAVIIGFRLFFGTLDFATGFVVLLLAPEFYLPLRKLGNHYHARLEGISAAGDMLEILQTPESSSSEPKKTAPSGFTCLTNNSAITLKKLNFTYPDSNEGLHDVSLCLPATGMVAFVGASGAGKSTLFDCLLGFHPQVIPHVNVNNLPLSEDDIPSWQQSIAWIPQQPTLFYTTIKENILLAKPNATMEEVKRAAQQAGALDFIELLPNGFDTLLGEQGEGLSGGQKQRIALARAFLKQAPILMLDEPTAHLDSATEFSVQHAINEYAKSHLVLVIAHRLNTLKKASNIVLLDNGRIVQQGDYQSLSQQDGPFKTLLTSDMHEVENE
ncbi:thiol reductant ABC exporter subunit CydD [Paraglaciecola chathamensis]|uniref:thiol reductant ABC exporter subunit CydD n=1 Tax=Paraglaciecola chathamensis TaxID=368405 RepID=UPI0027103231|nr:thiol reductant ABC exporter subunit CydD [Paraglaciecola chathamensis]MDO6561679.1 thiol reductant ABC exporter subunit CydD [Paraglaciecola chathamensis]